MTGQGAVRPGPDSDPAAGAAKSSTRRGRRSASRLAAVQALYQIELGGGDPTGVIADFLGHHQGAALDGQGLAPADSDFFQTLAQGVSDRLPEVDQILSDALSNQSVDRLDATLRALLRAGTFELMAVLDVPARASIDEYLDLAHAFFSGSEPKLVNGVLDHIARDLRPDELNQKT